MDTGIPVEIRAGRRADIPALREMCQRTLRACYTPFLGTSSVEGWIAGQLDDYLDHHIDETWVAVDPRALCGCAIVTEQLLAFLLVDVARHRRGVGTRLIEHAESLVFDAHDEIRLESFVANDAANRFYERREWSRLGRHRDADSGVDVWEYSKRRSPAPR